MYSLSGVFPRRSSMVLIFSVSLITENCASSLSRLVSGVTCARARLFCMAL